MMSENYKENLSLQSDCLEGRMLQPFPDTKAVEQKCLNIRTEI